MGVMATYLKPYIDLSSGGFWANISRSLRFLRVHSRFSTYFSHVSTPVRLRHSPTLNPSLEKNPSSLQLSVEQHTHSPSSPLTSHSYCCFQLIFTFISLSTYPKTTGQGLICNIRQQKCQKRYSLRE